MKRHAIVIGGGPGGLVTGLALASRHWKVTVLERAEYPSSMIGGPRPRRGAMQSHCLHMLMGAGAKAFDTIAPGWRKSVLGKGAVPFDAMQDALIRVPAGWLPRIASEITMYACSRTLLEHVLHAELSSRMYTTVLQGKQVMGLLVSDERVCGVKIASAKTGDAVDLNADLVVDVSGTASRLSRWLSDHPQFSGCEAWPETKLESPWQYVSRWFRIPSAQSPDWHCLAVAPDSNGDRAAMMLRAEEDFWNVVLLARDGLQVPETDEDFTGFTSPLADGRLSKALQAARPASPIHHYGRTANRLRHIDQLPFWPRGLAILGDSVMTLDPYFGLGMTNAARGAVLLARHLDENAGEPFDGARFQKDLASLNEKPWKLATRCTTDGTPLAFDHDRLARLYGAAPTNPDIARSILEVQHLLRDEDDLLKGMAA